MSWQALKHKGFLQCALNTNQLLFWFSRSMCHMVIYILSTVTSIKHNLTSLGMFLATVLCDHCQRYHTTGVILSEWWHIPEPKPILFCCHETFPLWSVNRESETTAIDLNQNLDRGGNFQEEQIINNIWWHFVRASAKWTVTFCPVLL